MRTAIVAVLLASAAGIAVWRLVPEPAGDAPPGPAWTGGRVESPPGMTILRLAGTPREKGRAHGERLRDRIRARFGRLDPEPVYLDVIGPRAARALPAALREEIEGIAAGCGLSFEQVWHLNLCFDLGAFEGRAFAGEAAVSAAGGVLRRFEESDLEGTPRELCVFVHEGPRPLVLVGLPGMAGGFLGRGAFGAAALRPVENAPDPVLTGLAWPLLLRELLSRDGEPALPAPATLDASIVVARRTAGTLDVSPRGSRWHPVDAGWALARTEPLSGSDAPEGEAGAARARRLFEEPEAPGWVTVVLEPVGGGVAVAVHRDGARFARVIESAD